MMRMVFLQGCGEMLRALHGVDPGPSPTSSRELARIGDPIEDHALVEWNMRIWYRSTGDVLRHLCDAYGGLPAWPRRHAAMIERCRGYYAASRDEVKREQLRRTEAF